MALKTNVEMASGISVAEAYTRINHLEVTRDKTEGMVRVQFLSYKDEASCDAGKQAIAGYRMELTQAEFDTFWQSISSGLQMLYNKAKTDKYTNAIDC
jgi:hypothetical protein